MKRLKSLFWLIGFCMIATQSFAQRPSLSGLEDEIKRTNAALCAQAEILNPDETYRPFICEPACSGNCIVPDSQTYDYATCVESPAYNFTVESVIDFGTCSVAGCPSSGHCPERSFDDCFSGDPAAPLGSCANPAEQCVSTFTGGFPPQAVYRCVKPCSTDSDCDGTIPVFCSESSGNSCGACLLGENCINGECKRQCQTRACDITATRVLQNVRGPDSAQAAVCNGNSYNSADMLQCLAEVEQEFSIQCQTICGNGVLQTGEQCDDGNNLGGDGCSADCNVE